jgi:hypothetical protein
MKSLQPLPLDRAGSDLFARAVEKNGFFEIHQLKVKNDR